MIHRLFHYIVLPKEISSAERAHLARVNRIALYFFVLHFPVLIGVAALQKTGPLLAAEMCALALVGPIVAYLTFTNPRHVSLVFGITSMFMGGLLVHFGQGPMQIEMHFYFFTALALMAVFANPLIIVLSALTVSLHHLVLYFLLPSSVFNYQATIWAVLVHALFVVLESVAACFVARSFFDNVVGLEKIVSQRTAELHARNGEIHLILDNVGQGFLTAAFDGTLASEHSRTIEDWIGPVTSGAKVWEYLGRGSEPFDHALREGWQNLSDGVLAVEDILAVLPKRLAHGGRELSVEYKRIDSTDAVLVIVSDITARLAREQLESEQREMMEIFQAIAHDRAGFAEFFAEAEDQMSTIESDEPKVDLRDRLRALHTLKGNAGLFRVTSLAEACQQAEEIVRRENARLGAEDQLRLRTVWERAAGRVRQFIGTGRAGQTTVDEEDLLEIQAAIRGGVAGSQLGHMLEAWRHEPVAVRLGRVAEQARSLAIRLGKGPIDVTVDAGRLRLPPAQWSEFWSAFAHVIRNAVDHGLEASDERLARGKPERGSIRLAMGTTRSNLRLVVSDDGRGIDWVGLREVVKAKKLPGDTLEQLAETIFVDGVTTKRSITEISGLGVGMGAVRAACHKLGGTVRIESNPECGTSLEFLFPLSLAPGRAHASEAVTLQRAV
jgi:two-component system chemotaxis sensor kinase CheA